MGKNENEMWCEFIWNMDILVKVRAKQPIHRHTYTTFNTKGKMMK